MLTLSKTWRWRKKLAGMLLTGMLCMLHNNAIANNIPEPFVHLAQLLTMPSANNWGDYRSQFIAQWGRKPGQERWQMKEVGLSPERQEQVLKVLSELKLTTSWPPQSQHYDYAILPGATLPSMKARLDWLAKQWKEGVRFNHLVVLAGQRELTPEIDRVAETIATLLPPTRDAFHCQPIFDCADTTPMHETEAARLLLHYYPYPQGMEQISIQVVDSPRKWEGSAWRRSHTADTIQTWLEYSPKPGSTLVISTQPSAHYQDEVFRRFLPQSFTVETSTPELAEGFPMAVLLDGVATWLRLSEQPPSIH